MSTTESGPALVCPGCGSPDVDLGRGLFCGTCAPVPSPPVAAALDRTEAPVVLCPGCLHDGVLELTLERAEAAEAALEHAKAALAGDSEGVRLWMLDCGELVAKHRARAEAAEAKLAAIRTHCEGRPSASWLLPILDGKDGSEKEAADG